MSRSSARRAQVEPVPALVAVVAVCLAVGAYATVRAGVLPDAGSEAPANAVLADVIDDATPPGAVAVAPANLNPAAAAPTGYRVTTTVTVGGRTWKAGASDPPPDAAQASRPVPVRVAPGRIRPGRLVVEVWT